MDTDVHGQERGFARLIALTAAAERGGEWERRHEVLMERAEERDGLERPLAEEIYQLAEEEGLEPELALLLAGSGVGVIELEELDTDPERLGIQQAPPDWIGEAGIPVPEARRERRLRLSFRRLRRLLEETGSAMEAVRRFTLEPDVTEHAY